MFDKVDLDPEDWETFRQLGHKAWDDMVDHIRDVRSRPVWKPMPNEVREKFASESSPANGQNIDSVYEEFEDFVKPYSTGQIHPGFMGWVHGGGNPAAILGDMLASGLNMNCGGRDHVGIALEQQIVSWVKTWFDFPSTAGGLFVMGSSQANFMALLAARCSVFGASNIKVHGVDGQKVAIYASEKGHSCITKAIEMSGYGTQVFRKIRIDPVTHKLDSAALESAILEDKSKGIVPVMIFATVGTVDCGAIDNLEEITAIGQRENVWVHVDGAFGALGVLSPTIKPLMNGISEVNSIAFDYHKWGQVPYSAGMILVRDGEKLRECFSSPAAYLSREKSGLMSGEFWPCDYGPDLSRGCTAMKTWWTLKTHGTERIGRMMTHQCNLAQALAARVDESTELERVAPVTLNIVCFRYIYSGAEDMATAKKSANQSWLNRQIIMKLHEEGLVTPSPTLVNGEWVIRAAFFNNRIQSTQIDQLFESVIRIGKELDKQGVPDVIDDGRLL